MISFGACGNINANEGNVLANQESLKTSSRRTRRKIVIIVSLSCVVLIAMAISTVLGTSSTLPAHNEESKSADNNSIPESIRAVCRVTLYPDSCYTSLLSSAISSPSQLILTPEDLFKLSIQVTIEELSRATESEQYFLEDAGLFDDILINDIDKFALDNCLDLLNSALDHLNTTLYTSTTDVNAIKTLLTAVGTYQETCLNGFDNTTTEIKAKVSESLKDSIEFTSNSLTIIKAISADSTSTARSFSLRRMMQGYYGDSPSTSSAGCHSLLDFTWLVFLIQGLAFLPTTINWLFD